MELLNNLLALRTLDYSEIIERFKIKEEHIKSDSKYEKLSALTQVYNPDIFPVRFFLRNGKVVIIYSSDPQIVNELNGKNIILQYGDKTVNTLQSRAGKRSNLMVYPEEGFAVSIDGKDVQFIEIFQPVTMEKYKKEIYIEVGPFIR